MKSITTNSFEADVLKSDKPVLVDFGAEWCSPCKALLPTLESVAKERTDINFCSIDIEEHSDISSKYHIMSVPTLAVFKNGELLGKIVGNAPKAKIEDFLNKYV